MQKLNSWEEIPKKVREELEAELTEDILLRYNNVEYHDPQLIREFLEDKGYQLEGY